MFKTPKKSRTLKYTNKHLKNQKGSRKQKGSRTQKGSKKQKGSGTQNPSKNKNVKSKSLNPITKFTTTTTTKPQVIRNVPKLIREQNVMEDIYHIYLNLLIDLMGSSLYDAFIENINKLNNLNISLIAYPTSKFELNTNNYVRNFDTPCIFYKTGGDYTHFICTYKGSFDVCKNKITPITNPIESKRAIRNPCKENKNCLWDPYYNSGGQDCTVYGGLQKQSAHSFCQTFTLSCMIQQYLPENELTTEFKSMQSIANIDTLNAKNDILSMNAFYAKQIACKIVRYAFVNNLSLVSNGETIDCWDFLYEQITNGQYYTSPTLTYNNYKSFMVDFLDFCENITYEQFKSSSIMENIIY